MKLEELRDRVKAGIEMESGYYAPERPEIEVRVGDGNRTLFLAIEGEDTVYKLVIMRPVGRPRSAR